MSSGLKASDIVNRFSCELSPGDSHADSLNFQCVAPLNFASASDLSFLANEKYLGEAITSAAGGILCSPRNAQLLRDKVKCALFVCEDPYATFARVSQVFFRPQHPFQGISERAVIDSSAKVDASATVFPFCFVGPGAVIGARSVVYSGVFVGAASVIGEDCILYPNSVVREGCELGDRCILNPGAVIGGDGFGFAPSGMENVKIPQIGGVQISSDVEVGTNSSIDRGTMANTIVGKQTKIDSLVQIGHNAKIGEACFLAGQCGIAGSSTLGNRVTLAGQVGVSGHLQIGDEVLVLAQGGVSKSLPNKGAYQGTPAKPNHLHLRELAVLGRLAKESIAKSRQRTSTDSSKET